MTEKIEVGPRTEGLVDVGAAGDRVRISIAAGKEDKTAFLTPDGAKEVAANLCEVADRILKKGADYVDF